MLPWYPAYSRQYVAPTGAADDEIGKMKKVSARLMTFMYIGVLVLFSLIFLGVITVIVYLTYPRSNGVHTLTVETVDFRCPSGSWIKETTVGTFGKCYLFRTARENLADAKTDCLAQNPNAHLVTIKTIEDQKAIEEHHAALGISSCDDGYLTSGHRPTDKPEDLDDFVWHDGSRVPATYTKWQDDEPSSRITNCIMMEPSEKFRWFDRTCGDAQKRCYICEL